jgi:hypothetical protein
MVKVTLDAISVESKTLAELATEYQVHSTQITFMMSHISLLKV